ncbi:MAG: hypothetical protein ACRDZX_02410 [Acidimicrobiales bacterium]
MPLTSDERERFLASLRTDDAFRDQVRRELLTDELLGLPGRFAAFVDEVRAFVEATDRRLGNLGRDVGQLKNDVGQLKNDVGGLKGMSLEHKLRANPGYYLHAYARRVHVVGPDELLDELAVHGLGDDGYSVLARTDMFARGISRESDERVLLVVEATWRPHTGDVDRQVARRQVLADHGVESLAVIVATEPPTEAVEWYAAAKGVLLQLEKAAGAA